MRMSSKGRYAVVAILDVAANAGPKPTSLADVATRQKISLSYLEQLFAMLRRAGLVAASRGPGGGYRLQRPAGDITVAEVFQAVEEAGNGAENGGRDWSEGPAARLWDAVDQHLERFLARITLADLLAEPGRFPLRTGDGDGRQPSLSAQAKLA